MPLAPALKRLTSRRGRRWRERRIQGILANWLLTLFPFFRIFWIKLKQTGTIDRTMVAIPEQSGAEDALFRVRPTKQARREDIFQTDKEMLWVISQLKLLGHWPLDATKQTELGSDLDFSKVHYRNETFYELRLDDEHLRKKNLRVF
ncbi:MAG TPA: hypothetical protein VFC46_03245 [Humisphaera sp.]|nr:hypothetical protein [Humisphaera sp.]